ncbi:MAG TPA: hypothetical protein VJ205_05040 [Gammaproteobacteria bacterium]|nr:hypothetical protein [Gammaproteobacteria bacterium]
MRALVDNFLKTHPLPAARILERAPVKDVIEIFLLYPKQVGQLAAHLPPSYLGAVFEESERDLLVTLSEKINDNLLATLLKETSKEKEIEIIEPLPKARKKKVMELISYKPYQVGYYAKKADCILIDNMSIQEAIKIVELLPTLEMPIYVVDPDYVYVGALHPFSLLKFRKNKIGNVSTFLERKVPVLKGTMTLESVLYHPAWEDNGVLPVVGKTGCFLGVVSKRILLEAANPPKVQKSSENVVEGYILFSEMIWDGLKKFWGSLK